MKDQTRACLAVIWMIGSVIGMIALGIDDVAVQWAVMFTPALLIMPKSSSCCCWFSRKRKNMSDGEKAVGSGVI